MKDIKIVIITLKSFTYLNSKSTDLKTLKRIHIYMYILYICQIYKISIQNSLNFLIKQ